MTARCACGAPYDLEATPGLAARLKEGGLDWLPPAVTGYRLKDW